MLLPSIPEEPIKLAMKDEFFNLILELDALFRVMTMITMIKAILVWVMPI